MDAEGKAEPGATHPLRQVARGMPPVRLVPKEPPSMGTLPLTAGLQADHNGAIRTWEVGLPPTRRVRSIWGGPGRLSGWRAKTKGVPRNVWVFWSGPASLSPQVKRCLGTTTRATCPLRSTTSTCAPSSEAAWVSEVPRKRTIDESGAVTTWPFGSVTVIEEDDSASRVPRTHPHETTVCVELRHTWNDPANPAKRWWR